MVILLFIGHPVGVIKILLTYYYQKIKFILVNKTRCRI